MSAELARAVASLHEEGYPTVYYGSLTAIDVDAWEARCQMGARASTAEHRQRLLVPDLRVGGYALDNHPLSPPTGYLARPVSEKDDEFSLRHALWLQLDAAYKSAAADLLRKQAVQVGRGRTEYDTDDFTREKPVVRPREPEPSAWPREALENLCASASAVFRGEPGLLSGDAFVKVDRTWSRLRDSEGADVDFGREVAQLELDAVSISTDGMRHFATRRFAVGSPSALPKPEELQAAAKDILSDLKALSVAATTSPFSAPALFSPDASAAAVLAVAQRMSGEEQRNPGGAQTFRGKLGKPVLPKELSLYDDPTLETFAGRPLLGRYEFDDQGQPARRVSLIEEGALKGFLLSRYPVIGFMRSNGHGRAFAGYAPQGAPGSLFLTTKKPVSEKALLARLREECRRRGKPYGLWLKGLRTFVQQQGAGGQGSIRFMPALLYLVDAKTGAQTLVRDLDVVSTPLDLLNDIVAAGDDTGVKNVYQGLPMSIVTPSLVLADAELQRADTRPEKLPILPPPAEGPAAHVPSSPRIPTVPNVPYLQVQRYVLRGYGKPIVHFVMEGLEELRQHGEGENLVVEARLRGRNLPALGDAVRRMDRSMEGLAAGKPVETKVVAPAMTQGEFKSRFKDGWPQ